MKRQVAMLFAVLFLAPAMFAADNWGLGLKLGAGESDPKTLKEVYDDADLAQSKSLDENEGLFGVEVLYEKDLGDANKLGFKLGYVGYGENELEMRNGAAYLKATEETYEMPLSVYYKRDNGLKNWSWFAGVGLSYIRTKMDLDGNIAEGNWSKGKVFPHLLAGAEYRFTEVFALGVEAKYNFSAKLKKDGDVLSDHSGFSGALTGRFYF